MKGKSANEMEWHNADVDLGLLEDKIFEFLRQNGFKDILMFNDLSNQQRGMRAKKSGILRTLRGSKAYVVIIIIDGNSNAFTIKMRYIAGGVSGTTSVVGPNVPSVMGTGFNANFVKKLRIYIVELINSLRTSIPDNGTQQTNKIQLKTNEYKFCIICGRKLPQEALFCSECGRRQKFEG